MSDLVYEIKAIIKATGTSIDVDELKPDQILMDAGIDSLEIYNVLLSVEEKYNIEIPEEDIDQLKTIKNLVEYIKDLQ